jgi:PIN domain nuclease of toxin-antitoxin system
MVSCESVARCGATSEYLLDASAALVPLLNETGAARVVEITDGAGITSVNLAEVVTRLVRLRHSDEIINAALESQDFRVVPIDEVDGRSAGLLERFSAWQNCLWAIGSAWPSRGAEVLSL